MTKEEREVIRARCEFQNLKAKTDIFALLDALDEMDRDIETSQNDHDLLTEYTQGVEAERDQWKARAEALGKKLCKTCVNTTNTAIFYGEGPCAACNYENTKNN